MLTEMPCACLIPYTLYTASVSHRKGLNGNIIRDGRYYYVVQNARYSSILDNGASRSIISVKPKNTKDAIKLIMNSKLDETIEQACKNLEYDSN
jgi:hypothetical protein